MHICKITSTPEGKALSETHCVPYTLHRTLLKPWVVRRMKIETVGKVGSQHMSTLQLCMKYSSGCSHCIPWWLPFRVEAGRKMKSKRNTASLSCLKQNIQLCPLNTVTLITERRSTGSELRVTIHGTLNQANILNYLSIYLYCRP